MLYINKRKKSDTLWGDKIKNHWTQQIKQQINKDYLKYFKGIWHYSHNLILIIWLFYKLTENELH